MAGPQYVRYWEIEGSKGNIYKVSQRADGDFACSCPKWIYCKKPKIYCHHICQVLREEFRWPNESCRMLVETQLQMQRITLNKEKLNKEKVELFEPLVRTQANSEKVKQELFNEPSAITKAKELLAKELSLAFSTEYYVSSAAVEKRNPIKPSADLIDHPVLDRPTRKFKFEED